MVHLNMFTFEWIITEKNVHEQPSVQANDTNLGHGDHVDTSCFLLSAEPERVTSLAVTVPQ